MERDAMQLKPIVSMFLILLALPPLLAAAPAEDGPRWTLEIESGAVLPGYNNVQVSRSEGTRFSLKNDLNLPADIYYRLRLTWQIAPRHALSALFAPLTLAADGRPAGAIRFAGKDFAAGTPVDATYRFNSYRLTYRYTLVSSERVRLGIGFTAKIRDAVISVSDGTQEGKTTNVGFVPLLNLHLDWKWTPRWSLLAEVDALAAPGGQGRAEDVAVAVAYTASPAWRFKAGYRLVEGGANVESVYNFALINYLFAGALFSW